jgi:methylated-DNA-[protein]-cysteine S-methyltransferase
MKSVFFYEYPIGAVGIAEEEGKIARVFFCGKKTLAGFDTRETPLLQKAAAQLGEYFAGRRRTFDLPLALRGTEFQLAVWRVLQTIPYGETRSYGEVAARAGNPRACRAAGMANNRNPIAIIVPCHRVIGADGSLTGYGGGLSVKRYLLDLEKARL